MSQLYEIDLAIDNTLTTYTTEVTNVVPMPHLYDLHWSNINDYVGLNFLWSPIIPDTIYLQSFLTAIITSAVIIFSFGGFARLIAIRLSKEGAFTVACDAAPPLEFDLIVLNILTALIYGIQVIPYCFGVVIVLYTSRFDLVAPAIWPYSITSLCIHMILYVADIVIRFKYPKFNYFVFFHHIAYCLTVFVALSQKDIFSIKFVNFLDASLTCEFGLYALMAYSKLHRRHLTPPWVIFGRFSVIFFIITRILQTIILVAYFHNNYSRMMKYNHIFLYTFDCVMAILISCVQIYTVHEYAQWKTLWGKRGTNYEVVNKSKSVVDTLVSLDDQTPPASPYDHDTPKLELTWSLN